MSLSWITNAVMLVRDSCDAFSSQAWRRGSNKKWCRAWMVSMQAFCWQPSLPATTMLFHVVLPSTICPPSGKDPRSAETPLVNLLWNGFWGTPMHKVPCLSACLHVCLAAFLSVCLSVFLLVCLSTCLSLWKRPFFATNFSRVCYTCVYLLRCLIQQYLS